MKYTLFTLALTLFFGIQSQAQHVLETIDGKKINGKMVSATADEITFMTGDMETTYAIGEVASITFDVADVTQQTSDTKGVYYRMPGREMTKSPVVNNLTQKKGIVVVEVVIDKYGTVRKATPGAEGTTTTDAYLHTMAKKAAQSARFNNLPSAPLESTGTITVTF
ncbi:MAG: hypothetical protein KJO64_04495 [Bacteroidia bacterium]|nr:hypothetical protein [Bacteroidia bacterium]NNC85137.1 hypothetical protein [Bacteroidia bacterium]